jgi:hypothetical protein
MATKLCVLLLTLTALGGGCANPGVVQLSPDTYLLAREDKGGIFGNAQALKAGVIRDANAFAESQGKVAIPVSSKATPAWPTHFATFDYQFRVVDKDSPEAKRAVLTPVPDVVVQNGGTPAGQPFDLYAELTKLDELRKRGLLTDAEFETQKQMLLNRGK